MDIASTERFFYHYWVNLVIAPLEMRCKKRVPAAAVFQGPGPSPGGHSLKPEKFPRN